jgi:hypothetical protein
MFKEPREHRPRAGFVSAAVMLVRALVPTALIAAVATAGCAARTAGPVTVRVLGAIESPDEVAVPADATILVRLQRDGSILDEVSIDPGRSGPPYAFELLYDRTQAGGTGLVVVEVRRDGRVGLGTAEGVAVQLDGSPAMLSCRIGPPRRSIGP